MSLFLLFAGVVNHIHKLQWDFLLGGIGEEFKSHPVSWSMVCSPFSRWRGPKSTYVQLNSLREVSMTPCA